MNDVQTEITAASSPGQSMLDLLPRHWTHAPADDGGWWLLGGDLAGDPDVMVRTEHAYPVEGGRDLTEPFTLFIGRLVARELGGCVVSTDLSNDEIKELNSQLRWLRTLMRAGR